MEKSRLLDRVGAAGDDRLLLARVLDKLTRTQERNIPSDTDFLSPQQMRMALDLMRLAGVPEDGFVRLGGYEGAERQILLFLPDWLEPEYAGQESPLRFLRAVFREEYGLSHRDLLGSLMGMGIVREKVGDLLVDSASCDLVVLESVADFLLQSWDQAGRAKLTCTEIGQENLHIPQVRCEDLRDTVAALRLDAVAAAGFRMARGKAAAVIESGRVQVNWREVTKPDRLLAEGDVVTARGFGKIALSEVGGVTRKGRIAVTIRRYL